MEQKLIRSWATPFDIKENKITGLGLVWFDGTEGTRHAIGSNQWEALSPNAKIAHHRNDVICCFNHQFGSILGRQSNGTLQLSVTPDGYKYTVELNDQDPEHMSMLAKIKRGDVYGSSATFLVSGHEWTEQSFGDVLLYNKIELIEIGPVSIPAMTKSNAVAASNDVSDYTKQLAETRKRLKMQW